MLFLVCVAYIQPELSVNQSIKSNICKAPIIQSSQRRLFSVGLHKEPSLKARFELFTINTTVLEMRWQHVPNLGCHVAETARTITSITHCDNLLLGEQIAKRLQQKSVHTFLCSEHITLRM